MAIKPRVILDQLNALPTCNKEIINEVAVELGISPTHVEEITKFVGDYTIDVIKGGTFETVMLPYFGKYKAVPKRIEKMFKHKEEKDAIIRSKGE